MTKDNTAPSAPQDPKTEAARSASPHQDSLIGQRVFICDRKHPHYGESGTLTGKIISLFGKPMTEVHIENCKHGTDGCFVSAGQIQLEKRTQR